MTEMQRDRFPFRLTEFYKRSLRRQRFLWDVWKEDIEPKPHWLYGDFKQAPIWTNTLNYCVDAQATLRCIVSTVFYNCKCQGDFFIFGKSTEQWALGFPECGHVFVAKSKLFTDLFSCTIHCFDQDLLGDWGMKCIGEMSDGSGRLENLFYMDIWNL